MFCTKCGFKSEAGDAFCRRCGGPLSTATPDPGVPSQPEEQVILTVPKCQKNKFSGRVEFFNLMITNSRIIGAKLGDTGIFAARKGIGGALLRNAVKGRLDSERFAGKELDEIIGLDKDNFAMPFGGFDEIKVKKTLGTCQIHFSLGSQGKELDPHSVVPKYLNFDGDYLDNLRTTLKSLAGARVTT